MQPGNSSAVVLSGTIIILFANVYQCTTPSEISDRQAPGVVEAIQEQSRHPEEEIRMEKTSKTIGSHDGRSGKRNATMNS